MGDLNEKYINANLNDKSKSKGALIFIKESGDIIWVQQRGKVLENYGYGEAIRIVSTVSDITDRKNNEEKILFLSYSDKLTGLRNRSFMEKQFQQLDNNKESNYTIIMGDINGLKLANDTLG